MNPLNNFPWFSQLDSSQNELLQLAYFLYDREAALQKDKTQNHSQVSFSTPSEESQLYDYSFVVFPVAKAYEGFLKQYLFDLQLINQNTFEGKRFRIGRALNPDIRESQQDEFWLYDDLELMCGKQVAHVLWQSWLQGRNRVVHFFPLEKHRISLSEARERIEMIVETMDMAYQCKVELER